MTNKEFHVPFLKNLVIIASLTLVSMAFAHYYIPKLYGSPQNTQEYTSSPSYNTAKVAE
jgi:ABC-type spermidine/putrescine transport system permease subunit I